MKSFITVIIAVAFGIFVGHGSLYFFDIVSKNFAAEIDEQKQEETFASENLKQETEKTESQKKSKPKVAAYSNINNEDLNILMKTAGYNFMNLEIEVPNLDTELFAIFDLDSGEVIDLPGEDIIRKEVLLNTRTPIASVTKLMTVLVAIENFDLSQEVVVSRQATATYGQQGNLSSGDRLSIEDLINIVLLTSSNDGSEAIALNYLGGRESFIDLMNKRVDEVGLLNTSFKDPSGLSPQNISSLKDLVVLSNYIEKNYPEIFEITRQPRYSSRGKTWFNNSRFRNDITYYGGKNGFIPEANQTIISIFDLPIGENNETKKVGFVVLGSENVADSVRDLLLYVLQNVEYVAD